SGRRFYWGPPSLRGAFATKQSRLFPRRDSGLLRFARNDEDRVFAPYFTSASAARMRAQERMPFWKLLRSYFSFGEWMLSSSSPKPTRSESRPSVRLKSATIGIEAPDPISTV